MKKILLGTTTLVGAAFFANAALAEAPKVTVGGFSEFQAGWSNQNLDNGQRHDAFRNDNEISFKVDGKSDAGLGYGAEVWLETDVTADADNQGLNASKTFLYLDGGFGRFEMGSNLGADQTLKIDASSIARATGGIDGDFTYFSNVAGTQSAGGVNTPGAFFIATPDLYLNYGGYNNPLGDESKENITKVTYYTPRFYGFQAGVSYLPDEESRGQLVSRTRRSNSNAVGVVPGVVGGPGAAVGGGGIAFAPTNTPYTGAAGTTDEANNIFVGGLNYEGKWDGIGFGVAGTGEWGKSENRAYEDLHAWQAGAKATFLGFSVAGSYGDWSDSNRLKGENADGTNFWTVGGAYEFGPFGVSVTYLNSRLDNGNVAGVNLGTNHFDNLAVGADYKLAPGLTPYAEVSFFSQDASRGLNAAGIRDNDGTVVLVGTQLNF